MLMMPPAVSSPHGSWYSPTINCRPTGQVRIPWLVVNMSANRNSFHDEMAIRTAVAATPGRASGSTTRTIAPARVQPSMRAASSSSGGMLSKKPFRIQMLTGVRKAVYASASPRWVSYSPRTRKAMKIGNSSNTAGNMRTTR